MRGGKDMEAMSLEERLAEVERLEKALRKTAERKVMRAEKALRKARRRGKAGDVLFLKAALETYRRYLGKAQDIREEAHRTFRAL